MTSLKVILFHQPKTGYGFTFCRSTNSVAAICVDSIVSGGEAEISGLVRPGDLILKVNDVDISHVSLDDATRLLNEAMNQEEMRLLIRPPLGYTTKLETTFDEKGSPRTYRVTEKVFSCSKDRRLSAGKLPSATINLNLNESNSTDGNDVKRRPSISPRERNSVRRPVKLRNVLSGQPSADSLHLTSLQTIGCSEKACAGSLMNWKHQVGKTGCRSEEEVIRLAQNFFDQYYTSIKRIHSRAHEQRWKEVLAEIRDAGTYELTETELIFGAKLAWRNAARCIGRIQWSKLQVFDFRSVSTPREMFEAICNHLKYATNRGNLRSAITIFPQRRGQDTTHDFRVWNNQLISYAGYADPNEPGKVTGDPINVEFTQLCEKLGWKGSGSRWDILPLVLSANGQDPQVFQIPDELVLRVKLQHPKYSWWQELDLEWYALPAVSGMMLDVGGLEFPAVPFSGWYMVTEIACRDLCDSNRYNILPIVAEKLGLDTRSNASLWKDLAVTEVTVAVLDSFQKAGVTIVDHHTASESFMKHIDNEQRLRGGCPADWVWIVPPLSSSLTPVFHQEMLNYELKPSYEYQESPMRSHVWKNVPGSEEQNVPTRKIRFKEIAKAVKFTSNLFGKALSKRIKATILYATETGKSEQLAKRLSHIFSHAFNVNVLCMDAYDTFNLEHEALLLIVTSTFGNGDPPENGETFARQLQAIKVTGDTTPDIEMIKNISVSYIRISSVDSHDSSNALDSVVHVGPLSNIRFAVFALGSSAYPNFCAFGRYVDNMLCELGGERIARLGMGDELCGQEQAFNEWSRKVFREAGDVFCIGDEVNMTEVLSSASLKRTTWSADDVRLVPTNKEIDIISSLGTGSNRKVVTLTLQEIRPLYDIDGIDARQTIRVQLRLQNSDSTTFSYLPGDHLGVFAENDQLIIDAIQKRLCKLNFDDVFDVQLREVRQVGMKEIEDWIPNERLPRVSLRQGLLRFIDIITPPTQQILALMSCFCSQEADQLEMQSLSTEAQKYEDWKAHHQPSLLDVLEMFPSLEPSAEFLLTQLSPLQPRFYSISSAPSYNGLLKSTKELTDDMHNDCSLIDLTVAVVKYKTASGIERKGVCSTFLCETGLNRPGHTIYGFIRSAPNFRLPDREDVPVIMVGPGTGIAPFRGFWLHRLASMKSHPHKKFGQMNLFCGCRLPTMQLYKQEVQEMKREGVLKDVFVALSRCPNLPKMYVQDFLLNQSDRVYNLLFEQKAHFYVCGDVSMAEGVIRTLKEIFRQNGIDDPDQALINLRETMRFHEDIFGITLRTAEVTKKGRTEALSKRSSSSLS